jgi:hypothetical protein
MKYFFIFFIFYFIKLFLRWAGPRPHIPFPPDLILYVNLVAMGPMKYRQGNYEQPIVSPQVNALRTYCN